MQMTKHHTTVNVESVGIFDEFENFWTFYLASAHQTNEAQRGRSRTLGDTIVFL